MERSTFAIILSILAILMAGFSAFGRLFDINHVSFPLGVLTLLVTILIAWQIFTALGIKKEIKDATKKMDEENSKLSSRLEAFESASNQKIEKLKGEQGVLELSHSRIELSKDGGKAYFTIKSNTNWNIYPNNNSKGENVKGLNVFPVNGSGNMTITVEYDGVETQNYNEKAVLAILYKSYGTQQHHELTLYRRHLPD